MTRTIRRTGEIEDDGTKLPKYFGKSGPYNADPNKIKKDGGGRGNWGTLSDEMEDLEGEFNFHHTRRRSNSMSETHPDARPEINFELERREREEEEEAQEEEPEEEK